MSPTEIAQIVGAIAAFGWVANAIYQARRAGSENRVDDANAESISVSTLSATIKTLNAQMEAQDARHKKELADLARSVGELESKLERVLDELETEQSLSRDRGHELERYRLQLSRRDERIAQLEATLREQGARIDVLESYLRAIDVDPDAIEGEPI
ncbi:MAG: hypothetical protein HKO76_10760 [Acidimicrobiia bacterium]|nr:hypothetical protein [Acidimicrobiia bacterium]